MVDPVREAGKILEKWGKKDLPVDVKGIAEHLGARVVEEEMPGDDDLSGMLFQDKDQIIIGVNSKHSPNRCRFTIAHEIGHMVMHRNIIGRMHIDKSFGVRFFRDGRSKQGKDLIEIQANRFAAELLMPTELLKKDIKDRYIDIEGEGDTYILQLAEKYQVSAQAMSIRLSNLLNDASTFSMKVGMAL